MKDPFPASRRPCGFLAGFVALLLFTAPLVGGGAVAVAGQADPLVDDPVIEARLRHLGHELRCLVCQGQSIAESDSGFANDVRREMYLLMKQGRSDQEVIDFLVQRYGDFILFRPPMKPATLLLWLGPVILLLIGAGALAAVLVRRRRQAAQPLSEEELRQAAALLADGDGPGAGPGAGPGGDRR